MYQLLILLFAVSFGTGCQKQAAQSGSQAPAQPAQAAPGATAAAPLTPPAAKPVPAQLPAVVARVNGEEIGRDDFEGAVRNVEGRAGRPVPADRRDSILRDILDQMIGYRLLEQEAVARKIQIPAADIDAQIASMRKQFPTEQAFKDALALQKVTIEKLRDQATKGLAITKLLEGEIGPKVVVADADLALFYQQNVDKFKQGEQVHASHILITVAKDADAAAKTAARQKAEGILAQLKGGADFATLAKQNSQDPGSAQNGGDLGYFGRGQMVPSFEAAAFALKNSEISGLVETQFGFHIIKTLDHKAERQVPLEEAKDQIKQYLTQKQREEKTNAFIQELRSKGTIEVLI